MTIFKTIRTILGVIAMIYVLFVAPQAMASVDDFVGTWVNKDADTRGTTRLVIKRNGAQITVQAFGSCSPSDCDWGTVSATAFSNSVSSDLLSTATDMTARFASGGSERMVALRRSGSNMRVTIFTRFIDESGRSNYVKRESFKKQLTLAPGIIQNLGGLIAAAPTQDCIGFNNAALQVKKVGGRWKIVAGSMLLLDFAGNKAEADKAFAVMKAQGFTQQCFVGRPGPSFEYFLSGNTAPSANISGADCIGFNNANIKVKQFGGKWKIVDGSHWMFDFAGSKSEADRAHKIIKYYGFTKTCYVGRPGPSLTYLVK